MADPYYDRGRGSKPKITLNADRRYGNTGENQNGLPDWGLRDLQELYASSPGVAKGLRIGERESKNVLDRRPGQPVSEGDRQVERDHAAAAWQTHAAHAAAGPASMDTASRMTRNLGAAPAGGALRLAGPAQVQQIDRRAIERLPAGQMRPFTPPPARASTTRQNAVSSASAGLAVADATGQIGNAASSATTTATTTQRASRGVDKMAAMMPRDTARSARAGAKAAPASGVDKLASAGKGAGAASEVAQSSRLAQAVGFVQQGATAFSESKVGTALSAVANSRAVQIAGKVAAPLAAFNVGGAARRGYEADGVRGAALGAADSLTVGLASQAAKKTGLVAPDAGQPNQQYRLESSAAAHASIHESVRKAAAAAPESGAKSASGTDAPKRISASEARAFAAAERSSSTTMAAKEPAQGDSDSIDRSTYDKTGLEHTAKEIASYRNRTKTPQP